MLRTLIPLLALSLGSLHGQSAAAPPGPVAPDTGSIKAAIERHTDMGVVIDRISQTPIAGLYEVVAGADIFYADAQGRYVILDGRLMDLATKEDLTQKKIDGLSSVDFGALPLHLALKRTHGSGKRVIAIFEDPTCPACKVVHKFIAQLPDLTVYTFPLPIASPGALPLVRSVWCQADRSKAWEAAMAGQHPPVDSTCDVSALDEVIDLAARLKIAGTPTIVLSDGRRIVGALPPGQLVEMIDQLGAAAH